MTLEFHPLANIFPLLEGGEFDDLVADIKANGLHEPIVMFEDKILDGRNRYRACMAAGVDPTFIPYRGDDPVGYVISLNLRRRHLDESQRAMVAAKLATLKDGQRADLVEGLPIGGASDLLNVGERSVARAREVQEHGAPELVRAVERGQVSVSAAADVATLPKAEQQEVVARGEREILQKAMEIRGRKREARRAKTIERLAAISNQNAPLPDRKYPIIYADPPWSFDHLNGQFGPQNHYPLMSLDEICALPVADRCTRDAWLFLWTPSPIFPEALRVVEQFGFTFKTTLIWVKTSSAGNDWIGPGDIVRLQHEILIIGRRGDPPSPAPENRPSSVIRSPRREHSQKPDEIYEIIEAMFPTLPKLELFARQARQGWDCWGNEAPAQYKAIGD